MPRVEVQGVARKQEVTGGPVRIHLRIVNHGYLGSYGPPSAKSQPLAEPLRMTEQPAGGARLLPPPPTEAVVVELGHLEGWGSGRTAAPACSRPGHAATRTSASSPWQRWARGG